MQILRSRDAKGDQFTPPWPHQNVVPPRQNDHIVQCKSHLKTSKSPNFIPSNIHQQQQQQQWNTCFCPPYYGPSMMTFLHLSKDNQPFDANNPPTSKSHCLSQVRWKTCIQHLLVWRNVASWKKGKIPSGKLTWQWKMNLLKMYSLLKMVISHCYVSLLECSVFFFHGNLGKLVPGFLSIFRGEKPSKEHVNETTF